MRCKACDAELEDRDLSRRGLFTGEFLDLCTHCYRTIEEEVPLIEIDNGIEAYDDDIQDS